MLSSTVPGLGMANINVVVPSAVGSKLFLQAVAVTPGGARFTDVTGLKIW
ncbi:MAG: hypothetical protein R3F56_07520 [Planctomycetota bacterium]